MILSFIKILDTQKTWSQRKDLNEHLDIDALILGEKTIEPNQHTGVDQT